MLVTLNVSFQLVCFFLLFSVATENKKIFFANFKAHCSFELFPTEMIAKHQILLYVMANIYVQSTLHHMCYGIATKFVYNNIKDGIRNVFFELNFRIS